MTIKMWLMAIVVSCTYQAYAQLDYYVSANANMYSPEGADEKSTYPILWYDKEAKPKILIGGFGVATFVTQQKGEKFMYKGEVGLSRHVYWEAIGFRDATNVYVGNGSYGSVDYTLHLIPTVNYKVGSKFFVGTGLGVHGLLASYSRVPEIVNSDDAPNFLRNKYYKLITPVIPLEISMKTTNKFYSIRFEQSLGSRYKKDLAEFKKEHYGILSCNLGWKL
jgi:hypothetical protein